MGSKVISFRFDDDKLALLQQQRVRGESDNQTAMRLLMDVLGVEVKQSSIQSVDNIRIEIKESIADGDIKDAIATSYKAVMGNFNGLLEELQDIKSQLQELQIPPAAAAANDKLTIPNNTIENIRTTLKRKNKTVSAEQIRAAFKDAGWDGDNYQEIRKAVIDSLSGGEQP